MVLYGRADRFIERYSRNIQFSCADIDAHFVGVEGSMSDRTVTPGPSDSLDELCTEGR